MSKEKFTYRIGWIFTALLLWEVIFWILIYLILSLIGYIKNPNGGDHVEFLSPGAFYLFLLFIPMVAALYFNLRRTNSLAENLSERIKKTMLQPVSSVHIFLKFFFLHNAIALLIFTLAEPVFGSKKVDGTLNSMELVIALDVSNSMNVRDMDPEMSRLEIAKRALGQLTNNLSGEKIGLVLFAGSAYTQLPLTTDYYAAKLFFNDIQTNMMATQGTNVNQALLTAEKMFSEEKTSRAILIVTDGENHETKPDEALRKLKEKQIELLILGLGTTSGGPVPRNVDRPELGYKKNAFGASVISKSDPAFVNELITKSGGHGIISNDPFPNLSELTNRISQMKRTRLKDLQFEVKENRYQYPLALAILFFALYLLWSRRSFKLIDKIAQK